MASLKTTAEDANVFSPAVKHDLLIFSAPFIVDVHMKI